MNKERFIIGINREYNYHPAFHGEIFRILEEQFTLKELPIINFSEPLIRSPKGNWLSKQVFSFGIFRGKADLFFSPHILLVNRSDWVIDLEHPFWLFTDHYGNLEPKSISFKLRSWIAKRWLERVNCKSIIAWSNASMEMLIDFFGEKIAKKVSVIYPMVSSPVEIVKRPTHEVSLLFIMPNKAFEGERKGKDVALDIFRAVKNDPKVKLIFIGYLTDSEKSEFENRIEHYSQIEREKLLSEIYPKSDILLFPSRAETFGAVVIEAQSMGVIPIATYGKSVFSTPELIKDGENGFLVRNKETGENELDFAEIDVQKFCEIVRLLKDDERLRQRLSSQCREKYIRSKHNPANQKEDIINLFLGLMRIKR
jgi:glycosyltransferase involved in cell wall biosynthesis